VCTLFCAVFSHAAWEGCARRLCGDTIIVLHRMVSGRPGGLSSVLLVSCLLLPRVSCDLSACARARRVTSSLRRSRAEVRYTCAVPPPVTRGRRCVSVGPHQRGDRRTSTWGTCALCTVLCGEWSVVHMVVVLRSTLIFMNFHTSSLLIVTRPPVCCCSRLARPCAATARYYGSPAKPSEQH
jgi:hypothetical protein